MVRLPGYFTGYSSAADNSCRIRIATQEVTPEDVAEFQRLNGAFGWFIFSENKGEEIPEEDAIEEGKTASERLRAVLYLYWKQQKITTNFETWRLQQMEKQIDKVKSQLT